VLARILKLLHELGSIGTLGAVTVCLLLLRIHHGDSGPDATQAGADVFAVVRYVLMPSFVAVLLSGLLAIAATPAYMNAGWAWFKALLGLSLFEASLSLSGTAREAAQLSVRAATDAAALTQLAQSIRTETGVLWVLFGISLANVVFGIWRPRFGRRRASLSPSRPDQQGLR
jgi:hypothetical protein